MSSPRRGKVRVVVTGDDGGGFAADLIGESIDKGRARTLGLATGSSPSPAYREWALRRRVGAVPLTFFALDEYVGLPYTAAQSYHSVLQHEVAAPLGIPISRIEIPDGNSTDLGLAAAQFEEALARAGGVDLQLLGIGSNGHIGFNEPSSSFTSRTRAVRLANETRCDNARFFAHVADVPTHALTQGIGTIMQARKILLMARGPGKAAAVARALEGPVTTRFPASILQRHPDVTFVLDAHSSALLGPDSFL